MTLVKSRTAALVLATLMALIAAFAVSATPVMIDNAHALPTNEDYLILGE